MVSRRIEMVCGVLGGALGLAALGVGLFAPLWTLYCVPRGSGVGDLDCGSKFSAVQMAVGFQELASLWFAIALFGAPALDHMFSLVAPSDP